MVCQGPVQPAVCALAQLVEGLVSGGAGTLSRSTGTPLCLNVDMWTGVNVDPVLSECGQGSD